MKKILPLMLMLTLLLSGCGLSRQMGEIKDTYIDPAIESAKQGDTGEQAPQTGPNVQTDKSSLTPYAPVETVGDRLEPGALTELAASEDGYGRLLPYIGAYYYDDAGERRAKFGLTTAEGTVVLDPVLVSVTPVTTGAGAGSLILGRYDAEADAVAYAVCGGDGVWVTEFSFSAVYPMELGTLCVLDSEANYAVCYDAQGAEVFNTIRWAETTNLAPGSIDSLAECGDGYMKICYKNGQFGFIDKNGTVLNRNGQMASYFDEVRGFSGGQAVVNLYGNYNYIGTDGQYSIYGNFEQAGDFMDGLAVVKRNGALQIIDSGDIVKKELPDAASAVSHPGYIEVTYGDGTVKYLITPSLTEANIYDKPLSMSKAGYWTRGADGVRMRDWDGTEVYFSGAAELLDSAKPDADNTLYLLRLADDSCAVMDKNSRVVVNGQALEFAHDSVTGDLYILEYDEDGNVWHTASGSAAARGAIAGTEPYDGLFLCADDYSAGWRDGDGNWVLRLRIDAGD